MPLTPATIPALLERHGLSPSRALGQNFLADPNTARRIVRLAGVEAGDRVLEIGPGIGSLTVALLEAGARVTAVELDRHVVPALLDTVGADTITLVTGDAMTVDYAAVLGDDDGPWRAVSNLPYNVATPVVMRLLEDAPRVRVDARDGAARGGRAHGGRARHQGLRRGVGEGRVFRRRARGGHRGAERLHPRAAYRLGAGRARPPHRRRRSTVPSPDRLFALVRAGFGQRRKMLRGALRATLGDDVATTLTTAGIDPQARAETLTLDDWARLARVVG